MSQLDELVREIARDEYAELLGTRVVPDPVLINIAQAVKILGVSRDVVDLLLTGMPDNDFPAVRLGPKTIRIDQQRLNKWCREGGLGVKA